MGLVVSYSLYSSILLSLLYLAYKWVMAGENQHTCNRVALWSIYIVSLFAFPVVRSVGALLAIGDTAMPGIEVGEFEITLVPETAVASQPLWLTILLYVYCAGAILAFGRTLFTAFRLWSIISGGEVIEDGRFKIILIDRRGIAPFSWYRYIVMGRNDWAESGQMILTHELQHLRLRHWIDLLLAQMVGIFQWYNPAAWLMREELKILHEYQADTAVIESGIAVRDYQMLLIKKAVGARFPSLANSLNHSKLKKRITMMYNQKSSAARRLRGLALVPALAAALAVTNLDAVASVLTKTSSADLSPHSGIRTEEASVVTGSKVNEKTPAVQTSEAVESTISETQAASIVTVDDARQTEIRTVNEKAEIVERKDTSGSDQVFSVVETKPEFPGGDAAVVKYISENLRYPQAAYEKGLEGRVVVRFVITKDGAVGDTEILRGVDPELDAEAARVVKSLPAFTPGKMGGKPVAVYYILPITFKIKNKDENKAQEEKEVFNIVDGRPQMLVNGREVSPEVYVDGKLYEGSLNDIDPSTIESMEVLKDQPDKPHGVVHIHLKK